MSWGVVSGLFVAVLIVVFLAITFWAWSPKRKATFKRMANLPLQEDDERENTLKDDRNE